MVITYDLYKELELDRSWDEPTIKKVLKEIQRLWTKRQSACNDKEQLLNIEDILNKVGEGFKYLVKALRRKEYDKALDKAYKEGKIQDKTEEKMKSLLDEARQYYRKGELKLAVECLEKAIEGKINDPEVYDILARCRYDMKDYQAALKAVDDGTEIFADNINLYWLGARIAIVGTQDFDDAQQRVNKLIELAPNNSLGHSEQIYLHLYKGDEDLAFQEVDSYTAAHPEDEDFKRNIAYGIDSFSNTCYYYDQTRNSTFIADKDAYEKCVKLRAKAAAVYSDEYTQKQLENAKYYGQKEWDNWNIDSIKTLSIYGAILLALYFPVGIALLVLDGFIIYYSYRPYWQINKTYVTGEMGAAEKMVTTLGDYGVRFGGWFIHILWKIYTGLFKFIWMMVTGRFF